MPRIVGVGSGGYRSDGLCHDGVPLLIVFTTHGFALMTVNKRTLSKARKKEQREQ